MSDLSQFKKSGITNRGVYSATTVYNKDDIVTFTDGRVYACLINGTVGIVPTTVGKWSLMVDEPTIAVQTVGTGTNPATFTLTVANNTVTLNRVA